MDEYDTIEFVTTLASKAMELIEEVDPDARNATLYQMYESLEQMVARAVTRQIALERESEVINAMAL